MTNCTYQETIHCKACGDVLPSSDSQCRTCYDHLYVQELKGTIATLLPHLSGSEAMLVERMLEGITIVWSEQECRWEVVRQRTCADCEQPATVQHKASLEWYCRSCIFRHIHIEV